jgi:hypothetical protein
MLIVMTPYMMAAVATALKTFILNAPGSSLKLFQNNIVPTNLNVIADFTEATFDGYATHTMASLLGPDRQPDGSFTVYNFQHFPMTGSVTPNIIYGGYMLDPTGALILAARFPAPINMVDAFSTCDFKMAVGVSVNGLAGDFTPL